MNDRPIIVSHEFAKSQKRFDLELSLSQLPKLVGSCQESNRKLKASILGGIQRNGKPYLDLSILGSLILSCQRCLEDFVFEINLQSRFIIASSESGLTEVGDEPNNVNTVFFGAEVDVIGFIEDEVLLALPMAPTHELGECEKPRTSLSVATSASPFGILKNKR